MRGAPTTAMRIQELLAKLRGKWNVEDTSGDLTPIRSNGSGLEIRKEQEREAWKTRRTERNADLNGKGTRLRNRQERLAKSDSTTASKV